MLDAIAGLYLLATICGAAFATARLVGLLSRCARLSTDWRVRVLAVSALMGCMLVVIVEVTSLLNAISAFGLGTGWLAVSALLIFAARRFAATTEPKSIESDPVLANPERRLLLLISGLIGTVLFLLAVLTPPTSWDSLTYHLPRVLNWIQNGSVAHYATHDSRQLESGPFASFAVMQIYLVTNSDRLVNLVQWGAMILSAIGVSWIASNISTLLGKSAGTKENSPDHSSAWAILFVVTMPIGIVQAITTQTDYVVAFWVVSSAVFGLLFWKEPSNLLYAFLLGASIALGIITKATMVVTAGLLSACLVIAALRAASSNALRLRAIFLIAFTGIVIVAPHFSRNIRVFGSALGSKYIYTLMRNEYHAPGLWASNFLRNLSLHAASGIPPVTTTVNRGLSRLHTFTRRPENDRASTFFTSTFAYVQGYPISDNAAGNFWHLLTGFLAVAYAAFRFPGLRWWVGVIVSIVLATFILQNGYLRWTEWNARFHLPLFLILSPIAGVSLARLPLGCRVVFGLILACVGLHATLYNKSRPVLVGEDFLFQDRERQYFLEVPHIYIPAVNAVTDVLASESKIVGLRMYKDFFNYSDEMEYPFWVMLRNRGFDGKILNVGITNETARLSNSIPIQALISSAKGSSEEVTQALPYMLKYPPIHVYFSESNSTWARLTQLTADGTEQPLLHNPDVLELANNATTIVCRSARQGVLAVEAAVAENDNLVPAPTTLLVKTYAGFSTVSASAGARHAFEIPLPAGATAVQMGIAGNREGAFQIPIKWNWTTVNHPLPYIYISRIYDPNTKDGATTNALALPPGSSRAIQLVSGAAGTVELLLLSATAESETLSLGIEAGAEIVFPTGSAKHFQK